MATQSSERFRKRITKTLEVNYLLYLPPRYNRSPNKRWPLVLFLHGAGERGDSLELVKKHGPPKLIEAGQTFPFIVVSPQCPTGRWWNTEELNHLLSQIERDYRVDPERIYVTGLSMGGYGTWELALSAPHRFAALAPICGGGSPGRARWIAHLPIWVFHGAKDTTVPVRRSKEMVQALERAGGSPRLTIYPTAKHDSWTETYANPELYEWLLSHQLRASTG